MAENFDALPEIFPRILAISEFYPHPASPHEGIFVKEQLRSLAHAEVAAVIAPAVWYPPLPRYRRLRRLQPQAGRQQDDSFRVLRMPVRYFPVIGEPVACHDFFQEARKALAQNRLEFDLIHAHWAYRSGYVASLLAQQLGKPLVITAQGSDVNFWLYERRKRRRVLAALQSAAAIITLSVSLQEKILAEGISAEKIAIIPQGVDTDKFKPTPSILRQGLGNAFVYLCIANHYHVKGIDLLLCALAGIKNEFTLILIGSGPETGLHKAMAEELGIAARVKFVGAQNPESIPAWINAADAVVIPSRNEGGPAVLMEALACGKPVVATAVGQVPALLKNDQCGFMVPPEDVEALTRALARLPLKTWHPDLIRQQALPFAWDKIGSQVETVYQRVLERI